MKDDFPADFLPMIIKFKYTGLLAWRSCSLLRAITSEFWSGRVGENLFIIWFCTLDCSMPPRWILSIKAAGFIWFSWEKICSSSWPSEDPCIDLVENLSSSINRIKSSSSLAVCLLASCFCWRFLGEFRKCDSRAEVTGNSLLALRCLKSIRSWIVKESRGYLNTTFWRAFLCFQSEHAPIYWIIGLLRWL